MQIGPVEFLKNKNDMQKYRTEIKICIKNKYIYMRVCVLKYTKNPMNITLNK